MSSEKAKNDGEPASGPKTEYENPALWKEDLGAICAICGYDAAEHRSRDARCPVEVSGLLSAREWRQTVFQKVRTARVVETGYVGAPVVSHAGGVLSELPCPSPDSATGRHYFDTFVRGVPVDTAGVPVTCLFCGIEQSVADGKMSAGELREIAEAAGDPAPGGKLPCECWRGAGFRNCPRHRHLCGPGELAAFRTGAPGTDMRELALGEIMAGGDCLSDGERIPAEWVGKPVKAAGVYRGVPLGEPAGELGPTGISGPSCPPGEPGPMGPALGNSFFGEPGPTGTVGCSCAGAAGVAFDDDSAPIGVKCVVCGIDLASAPRGFVRGAPKGQTPANWQCPEHFETPNPRPAGPPAWFAQALGEARAMDLANAGCKLAKCGNCGGLLYQKPGEPDWFHEGAVCSGLANPTEIFDPAATNDAGAMACRAETPWLSNWDKLTLWLFPPVELALPEAPGTWKDVIHLNAVTHFSLADRVKLLFCGRLHTRAIIVCENEVGDTKSVSLSLPLAPGRGEHR